MLEVHARRCFTLGCLLTVALTAGVAQAKVWTRVDNAPARVPGGVSHGVGLGDGRAFATARDDSMSSEASAWLFDPKALRWSATANVPQRNCETLVELADGAVLCAFGNSGSTYGTRSTTAWVWKAGTWTATPPYPSDRRSPFAVRLADGRVLFAGGADPSSTTTALLTSCVIYDPVARTWTAAAPMPGPRLPVGAAKLLKDGRVVLVAVTDKWPPGPALFYDAKTGGWSEGPSLTEWTGYATATRNEVIVAVSGTEGKLVAIDGKTGAASALPTPSTFVPRELVAVGDRFVLMLGVPAGTKDPTSVQAALLDTAAKTLRPLPPPGSEVGWGYALITAGDSALIAGGERPKSTDRDVTTTDVLTMNVDGAPCSDADTCGSLACKGGVCGAACASDTDCASATSCEGGRCAPVVPLGGGCGRDASCASGHCLDGRCCADTKGCAPYVCASGGGCLTSCSVNGDCAKGFVCQGIACVPDTATATCSTDLSESIPKSGPRQSCAPYRCDPSTGACRTTCAKSDDCAPGSVCDPAATRCVPAAAGGDDGDDGGCALGSPGRRGTAGLTTLLVLMAVGALRRRR